MTRSLWPPLGMQMSSRVNDQPAFILRRRDWRNTSLILDLFTLDFGCISAVARGGRRSPEKVRYQPFVWLSVCWSGYQELKSLISAESQVLAVNEKNYLALLYINELIALFLPKGESSPALFGRYHDLLKTAEGEIDEADLRRFELYLMRMLGYFPDITLDADSGDEIKPEKFYQFVINSGFAECRHGACDAVSGDVVCAWINGDYQNSSVRRLARTVLRSTIDANLHGKAIKSREVYHDMLKRQ